MKLKNVFKLIIAETLFGMIFIPLCYDNYNKIIPVKAFATENVEDFSKYGRGLIPMTEEDMEEYLIEINDDITDKNIRVLSNDTSMQLPESCDLSESVYFPPIGNQYEIASCASWATTYYQFTYEAHKLNDIITTVDNSYSPRWTYNLLNNGQEKGSNTGSIYAILRNQGALTMKDYPYDSFKAGYVTPDKFDYSWSNNTEGMIKALDTRISGYTQGVRIKQSNASSPEELNKIRTLLINGKVLTFSTTITWEYANRSILNDNNKEDYINTKTGETELVAYRRNASKDFHAMTIVGYNDNVWCDINNNSKIDDGEMGAFKVANSWGKDWGNNGYIWVAYDALNEKTTVSGDWENKFESSRQSIFSGSLNDNFVYYINVENITPMYIGQLDISTDFRNQLIITAGRNTNDKEFYDKLKIIYNTYTTKYNKIKISHNGTLVFDFDYLYDPIYDYIDGYNWFVDVEGNHNSLSFKITDNLSNTIVDFGDISTGDSYKPINLSMGDLDYNGVVDINDSKILFNSIYNDKKLSNLQEYLASDMNRDFSVHAAITPSGYDDIGKVLDNLNAGNIAWDSVPSDVSLQTLIDNNYDVLFINCSSDIKTNGEVIRAFVEQGGTVYASDWALDALIEAFPERNITYTTANPQNITANITDKGLNTSTGLKTIPINFNLPDWRLINSTLQDDVTTYISGSVKESNNNIFPLAFSFSYGNNGGKVFYTSFHHEANITDEMQEVLNDLILTINHNKDINDLNEWKQINQYYSIMHNVGIAGANMSSKSYVLDNLENDKEFAVITNETGNFSIELTSPDGNIYTNYKNGEFLSGLISNPDDNIQVYSLGKRGLRISNSDAYSNKDNHWSYRVISHLPYRSSFVTGVVEKNEKAILDYIIDYKVTQDWETGQNVEVTITNIGDTPIRNWALQCDNFFGTITNIWNGKLQGDNIIRNDITNSDIASGSSVTIGYTLTNATGEVPEFTLCSFRNAKDDGYSVDFDILSDWGDGFIGNIIITNTTDTPIMAWELNFKADNFTIAATSQFEILTNIENNYTITGTYNGNIPIPAYSSVTLQFNGEKTGIPSISDIFMTEMIIQE